jgi:hypothetical protein
MFVCLFLLWNGQVIDLDWLDGSRYNCIQVYLSKLDTLETILFVLRIDRCRGTCTNKLYKYLVKNEEKILAGLNGNMCVQG